MKHNTIIMLLDNQLFITGLALSGFIRLFRLIRYFYLTNTHNLTIYSCILLTLCFELFDIFYKSS